jgi:hypothetical protein
LSLPLFLRLMPIISSRSSRTCSHPPPRSRQRRRRRRRWRGGAGPGATRTGSCSASAPGEEKGSRARPRPRSVARSRAPFGCAAGTSEKGTYGSVKSLAKRTGSCLGLRGSSLTWRWLFTSSFVSPSTFITSLICFGVATAVTTTTRQGRERSSLINNLSSFFTATVCMDS